MNDVVEIIVDGDDPTLSMSDEEYKKFESKAIGTIHCPSGDISTWSRDELQKFSDEATELTKLHNSSETDSLKNRINILESEKEILSSKIGKFAEFMNNTFEIYRPSMGTTLYGEEGLVTAGKIQLLNIFIDKWNKILEK